MTTGLLQAPAGAQAYACRRNAFKGTARPFSQRSSLHSYASTTLRSGSGRLAGRALHQAPHSQQSRRIQISASPQCQAATEKKTVAITGATGLIGSRLAARLSSQGHTVRVLTRNVNKARNKLQYARLQFYNTQQLQEAVRGADAVINLAGEPIATRWSPSLKVAIKTSRVETTTNLVEAINGLPEDQRPEVICSASAVGFYGNSQNQTFNENSSAGQDYLAEVCRDWEAAAKKANTKRVVIIRTGIVLSKEGGALAKMLPIFNIFAGGPLGTGQQWCSWIHRDDIVNLYIEAATNPSFSGTYNATAPNPVRMSELCSSLGRVLGRPSWLPVPEFALQSVLGEGALVVLEGQRVISSKAQDAGFTFKYTSLQDALHSSR